MRSKAAHANRVEGVTAPGGFAVQPAPAHHLESIHATLERLVHEVEALGAPRPLPQFLSKASAARMLGVGRTRTLQRLIDQGHLRAVTVGKRARIPLTEIERFLDEGEGPAPSSTAAHQPMKQRLPRRTPRPADLAGQLEEVRKMRI